MLRLVLGLKSMLALFASLWLCATVGLGCYRYYHFDLDFQSHSALHGISGIQVCLNASYYSFKVY
jgi:hypothetical protein